MPWLRILEKVDRRHQLGVWHGHRHNARRLCTEAVGQQCLLVSKGRRRCWGQAVLCFLTRLPGVSSRPRAKALLGFRASIFWHSPSFCRRLLFHSAWVCPTLCWPCELGNAQAAFLTLRQSIPWMELPVMALPRGTLHCCGKSVHAMCRVASLKPFDCKRETVRSMPIKWLQVTFPTGHSQLPSTTSPCWPIADIIVYGEA